MVGRSSGSELPLCQPAEAEQQAEGGGRSDGCAGFRHPVGPASAVFPSALAAGAGTRSSIGVREIKVSSERSGRLRLVTNDLTAPAEEIAGLYKERWEIELFFKWIKQNLKLRHFVGRGENAVKTQLYVALIAFLVLRLAHEAQKAVARPQAFARLVALHPSCTGAPSWSSRSRQIHRRETPSKSASNSPHHEPDSSGRPGASTSLLCAPTGRTAKRMSEATGLEAEGPSTACSRSIPRTGGFRRDGENPLDCGPAGGRRDLDGRCSAHAFAAGGGPEPVGASDRGRCRPAAPRSGRDRCWPT